MMRLQWQVAFGAIKATKDKPRSEEAWRVCAVIKGVQQAIAIGFHRKVDAEAARDALEKAGIDTLNKYLADKNGAKRVMLEALQW